MMMRTSFNVSSAMALAFLSGNVLSATPGAAKPGEPNITAISLFLLFVLITLGITWWASRRTRSSSDFYSAGSAITGGQNGLAIAGDYMSAATLLGLSGLVFASGFDGLVYTIGVFVGWPIILFVLAEPVRNLGRYTFADVVSVRLDPTKTRIFAAVSSLIVVCLYLVVQMVGGGQLIRLLFGLEYRYAVMIVGVLMVIYVTFGGMLATTWVQMIKAVLLVGVGVTLMMLCLSRFGFSIEAVFRQAVAVHRDGIAIMGPGRMMADPVSAISMSIGCLLGPAALPHILMRFFTVADAKAARKSAFVASGLIGFFFIVICVLGLCAIAIIGSDPRYFEGGNVGGKLIGGSNMPVMHLSASVGGDFLLGLLSAVAFATILAVVSGLALAGASAVSHDLYANVIRKGKADEASEMLVSRLATLGLGVVAVVLGTLFEKQNVAFLTTLTFGIAASSTFPVLLMTIYSRNITTRGALAGGVSGLIVAVGLVVLSKAVWVDVLNNSSPVFPYEHPALFAMPLAFFIAWLVSRLDGSTIGQTERLSFDAQWVRAQTGIGSAKHSAH
ncbi:cation/acetate symporter ActP [Cupriavidus sp. 2SB]|uniref:cation/acetate symporter ActP n=1 Tax=Cupriavidus sp. 2SB TaxID=2502199 RepID=UPI0010F70E6A|nr:cation/acetate symporter ActP [Cupriavidus sp. 2SB]